MIFGRCMLWPSQKDVVAGISCVCRTLFRGAWFIVDPSDLESPPSGGVFFLFGLGIWRGACLRRLRSRDTYCFLNRLCSFRMPSDDETTRNWPGRRTWDRYSKIAGRTFSTGCFCDRAGTVRACHNFCRRIQCRSESLLTDAGDMDLVYPGGSDRWKRVEQPHSPC